MYKLEFLRIDAIDAIEDTFEDFDAGAGRAETIAELDRVCLYFHVLAAAALLVDGDPAKASQHLCRAAENWRRVHLHAARRGWAPPPSGKVMPLLGAIAAPAWDLAAALASVSSADWQKDDEYEEEFRSGRLWQALALSDLASPSGRATVEQALDALDALGEKASADRIAVGRALLTRKAKGFEKALLAAATAHELTTEKLAHTPTTPHTAFAPYRYLWFEGLAWIRLGERAGLPITAAVQYCPPLARLPLLPRFTGDWVLDIGV